MFKKRLLIVTSVTFLLAGCSWIPKPSFMKNRDNSYLSARTIPPLKVPPGVSSSSMENEYPIPDARYPAPTKSIDVNPPGLN